MSSVLNQFTSITFTRFKAFREFKINLRHINVLVGPNNSGKSTILAAFRILAAALRKANSRKPEPIVGLSGPTIGYTVDLSRISVAEENIFFNYDTSEPAIIEFRLNNGNRLILYFSEINSCVLIPYASGEIIRNTLIFKKNFNCKIGFVPILGPVDHNELLYEKETAYNALYNYKAARNFRNIWHHFPNDFIIFKNALQTTWPGMDIQLPEVGYVDGKSRLHMYCLENRITREIFWSGFGFQVWCQMLTHVIQNKNVSVFLIDEPDIYLHAELQRQLLGILKALGPDIVIATHSTEMITESETSEIILINKEKDTGKRVRDISRLGDIFAILGSTLNPILTQLAKTRKVVFVEGKDFKIISQFARKMKFDAIASKRGFAVIEIQGFNPDRVRMLKLGIEETLGANINAAVLLDRDYRSDDECNDVKNKCSDYCDIIFIHGCKEIENYILVPAAMNRAASKRVNDRSVRSHVDLCYNTDVTVILERFCNQKKSFIAGQLSNSALVYAKRAKNAAHTSTISASSFEYLESKWGNLQSKVQIVPGKDALSAVNKDLMDKYSVGITPAMIIDVMTIAEIPDEMKNLVATLEKFVLNKTIS